MSYKDQIKITSELIEHVANMAMLDLDDDELEAMKVYFEEMLNIFDVISDVDVEGDWFLRISTELRPDGGKVESLVDFEDLQMRFPKLSQGYLVVPALRKGDGQ